MKTVTVAIALIIIIVLSIIIITIVKPQATGEAKHSNLNALT